MKKDNNFFEDLSKLSGSMMNTAFGTAADIKTQFENAVNAQIDEVLHKRGVVTREEFEVVKKMAEQARLENAELRAKLEK